MTLLTVDTDKCKQDGLCAADCPTSIINFQGKGSFPELVPGGKEACLRCGHCVAVCPHGAMTHNELPIDTFTPIEKDLAVSAAQAEQFLRTRRSVRQFKDRPPEKDTLARLIDIARYAPTGSNGQMVRWLVINDRDKVHRLAGRMIDWMRAIIENGLTPDLAPYLPRLVEAWDYGVDAVLRSAPCLVVAMAPEQDRSGPQNVTLALSYLDLMAPSFGLGTCWAGLLEGALQANDDIRQAVGIPDDCPHHYPMMIGYARPRYYRLPPRKPPAVTWA